MRDESLDWILTAAIALAVLLVWGPVLAVGIDLADEGWLVTAVDRMVAGQWIYRDFYRTYGPLTYLPFLPLFRWGEPDILAVRGVLLLELVVLCAWIYRVARPELPRWAAAFAALVPLVVRPPLHKVFVPLAYVAALWLCKRLARSDPRPGPIAGVGLALGLVALVRQDAGAFGFAVAAATLVWARASGAATWGSRLRSLAADGAALTVGAGLVWIVFLGALAAGGVLGDALDQLVVAGLRGNASMALPMPALSRVLVGPGRIVAFLSWLPSLAVAVGIATSVAAFRARPRQAETWIVAQWTALALCAHVIFWSRSDFAHVCQAIPVSALPIAAGASRAWAGASPGARTRVLRRLAAAACLAGLGGAMLAHGVAQLRAYHRAQRHSVTPELRRASVRLQPPEARGLELLVGAIQARAGPDEPIFIAGYAPLLYYLSERHNPTRHDVLLPGFASEAIQAEIIRALEAERVPLVVLQTGIFDGVEGRDLDSYAPALARYVRTAYRPAARLGPYLLMRRSGA